MPTTDRGPRFNLKAVVRQTGLKPDTLRAWERRYGLPTPARTEGGHRLYSQRDVDTIKWLMARQREGLSISRAVDQWRQLEAEGRDPLQMATPIAAPAPVSPFLRGEGGTLTQLREDWIAACLVYDEQRAEQVVNQAFALYPPESVAVELLQRAVAQIGEAWHQGEVTVQQEHFCSALTIRRLEALIMTAPPPTRPGRILAACPEGEDHVIGLLLLTFLLRRRGWAVVYLGANVPVDWLETTVAATRPQLAILAAQQLPTAATLLDMAQVLQREGVPLAYGGLIFNLLPALRERLAGHFLGERLDLAPEVVEELMVAPRPVPTVAAIPEACHQAREHYLNRQGLIEAQLAQSLDGLGIPARFVALASGDVARNLSAALTLGDIEFVGTGIQRLEGLLNNYRLPRGTLFSYLRAYHQAAKDHLDARGEPILAWLAGLLEEETEGEKRKV